MADGPPNLLALRCETKDFAPRVQLRRYIVVDTDNTAEPGDEVVAISSDGQMTMRRLRAIFDSTLILYPINDLHGVSVLDADTVAALHVVVGIAKNPPT